MRISRCLLGIMLFLLCASSAFSKDEADVLPFVPSGSKGASLDVLIEREAGDIKVSGYYNQLLQYAALRQDDLSACPGQACQRKVEKDLLPFRYFAEGRCGQIKDAIIKDCCDAVKSNNMEKLLGPKKTFYEAWVNDDIDSIVRSAMQITKESESVVRPTFLHNLAIYRGFKYYSATACERYMNQISIDDKAIPLYRQFACQILFYSDVNGAIRDIVRDLAVFSLCRKENRKDMCGLIQNNKIRSACNSSNFKDLDDIFGRR